MLKAVGKNMLLKETEYGISKCRYTGTMKGHSVVFQMYPKFAQCAWQQQIGADVPYVGDELGCSSVHESFVFNTYRVQRYRYHRSQYTLLPSLMLY